MRAADYVEETTTSIAGTSGDGAVTLTAITNVPRFSTVFGTQATTIRYVIEDTVNKKFEQGIGYVSSNVLTRTRPQVTWDGSTWDDSTPAALQFGSSPTSGNIKIRMAALAESLAPVISGVNSSISGDANWRDYPINNASFHGSAGTGSALTADREYYALYRLDAAGLLNGAQFNCTGAVASSNLKWALYPMGHDGLPGKKIVDFVTTSTAATGYKTDTATASWSPAGPVWLNAGWYYIGYISGHAITIEGASSAIGSGILKRTPLGRQGGYGMGNSIYVAGSYTTGLPATPAPTTMIAANSSQSNPWFGLKVIP